MNFKKKGIVKHKYCLPCMCDINRKLSTCKISDNKKTEFTVDSVKFTILNLNKKEKSLDEVKNNCNYPPKI